MSEYKYKMLQIPPNVVVQRGNYTGDEAAKYLQNITNEQAKQGWEFYRVDTFTVRVEPGCLGMIFGQRQTVFDNYVVTFRQLSGETIQTVNKTSELQTNMNQSGSDKQASTNQDQAVSLKAIVIQEDSYIKAAPGTVFSNKSKLNKGNELTLYGRTPNNKWVEITGKKTSWVDASHLQIDGDIEILPIIGDLR
jgi:hypothetical protein